MSAFLLATAMAVAPPPAVPTHAVAPSESLTWIAQCQLGDADRVNELIELNAELIDDPNILQPGWQLVLPPDASGACPEEPPARASARSSSSTPAEATSQDTPRRGTQARVRAQSASSSGGGGGGGLAAVRACESGGDYGAVSSNGKHRGAYQFDRRTWASVGGTGDPATASAAEQDRRAQALYRQRGSSPWPSCG